MYRVNDRVRLNPQVFMKIPDFDSLHKKSPSTVYRIEFLGEDFLIIRPISAGIDENGKRHDDTERNIYSAWWVDKENVDSCFLPETEELYQEI